ncbi:hypothetical protein IFM89_000128 [Coptis chinensis]|uniref:DUF659 domain-containing protein n=1 Tax=Coptis chinensis TaxID=261450 RepID=A0A835M204_9MAGN|nr:hypothetical protein IFM89_000128 [Coptis chinensis]
MSFFSCSKSTRHPELIDVDSTRRPDVNQPSVHHMTPAGKSKVGMFKTAVARFVLWGNLSPNAVANNPYYKPMFDEACRAGLGVIPPSAYQLLNSELQRLKAECKLYIDRMKIKWSTYGVSVMCDSWTGPTRECLMNFMVYCGGLMTFDSSVDLSKHKKDHHHLLKHMRHVVDKVGKENVVQIVTDNGANFKKAGEMLARENVCGGDLVRAGPTRFASNYMPLKSLLKKKNKLQSMFTFKGYLEIKNDNPTVQMMMVEDIINHLEFWQNVKGIVVVLEPIVVLLQKVDKDDKLTMPFLHRWVEITIKQVWRKIRSPEWIVEIIKKRWNNQLGHPLHKAAHYLNPTVIYGLDSENIAYNGEFLSSMQTVINQLVPNLSDQLACLNESDWWMNVEDGYVDHLKTLAIRILSQTTSSSGCERNWSTFGFVHSVKHCNLRIESLEDQEPVLDPNPKDNFEAAQSPNDTQLDGETYYDPDTWRMPSDGEHDNAYNVVDDDNDSDNDDHAQVCDSGPSRGGGGGVVEMVRASSPSRGGGGGCGDGSGPSREGGGSPPGFDDDHAQVRASGPSRGGGGGHGDGSGPSRVGGGGPPGFDGNDGVQSQQLRVSIGGGVGSQRVTTPRSQHAHQVVGVDALLLGLNKKLVVPHSAMIIEEYTLLKRIGLIMQLKTLTMVLPPNKDLVKEKVSYKKDNIRMAQSAYYAIVAIVNTGLL